MRMRNALTLVACAVLAVATLNSCTVSHDDAPAQPTPAVQNVVEALEEFALQRFNDWLFGPRASANRQSPEFRIQQVIVAAQAKFPDLSRAQIEPIVREQYEKAKAQAQRDGG